MAQQQTGPYTSKQYFKSLTVLCYALAGGIVLFALIMTVLVSQGISGEYRHLPVMVFVALPLIFSVIGVLGSSSMYNKILAAAKDKDSLKDMLNTYRAAVIMRFALLEGPALFTIIAFFLTGQYYLLVLVGVLVAIMLNAMPSKQKLTDALELSSQQVAILSDDDAVIE